MTLSVVNFPPGPYTFQITGKVGSKTTSASFTVNLVDPCPVTPMSINEPDPFEDKVYTLREPQID